METEFSHQSAFQRSILHALSLEWQIADRHLPAVWRGIWREPGFALIDAESMLGKWCPAPVREIRISLRCVTDHPWYAAVDVLRHEMAHQFADEVLRVGDKNETVHGPTFRRACAILGANPAASGSYPTIDAAVLSEASCPHDRAMQRIRKLLALGESPNRHEAELAVAKARELLARYGEELPGHGPAAGYVTICLGEPALRHGLEVHSLVNLIREQYPIRAIWVPMAVPQAGRIGRTLEISGAAHHVRTAHYVFEFIRAAIVREWQAYKAGRRLGRNGYRDFALGMISGFQGILQAQADSSPSIRAMILRRDPQLDVYFETRHPRRSNYGIGRGVRPNEKLMREGTAVAARIGLRQPIDKAGSAAAATRGRLLGRG